MLLRMLSSTPRAKSCNVAHARAQQQQAVPVRCRSSALPAGYHMGQRRARCVTPDHFLVKASTSRLDPLSYLYDQMYQSEVIWRKDLVAADRIYIHKHRRNPAKPDLQDLYADVAQMRRNRQKDIAPPNSTTELVKKVNRPVSRRIMLVLKKNGGLLPNLQQSGDTMSKNAIIKSDRNLSFHNLGRLKKWAGVAMNNNEQEVNPETCDVSTQVLEPGSKATLNAGVQPAGTDEDHGLIPNGHIQRGIDSVSACTEANYRIQMGDVRAGSTNTHDTRNSTGPRMKHKPVSHLPITERLKSTEVGIGELSPHEYTSLAQSIRTPAGSADLHQLPNTESSRGQEIRQWMRACQDISDMNRTAVTKTSDKLMQGVKPNQIKGLLQTRAAKSPKFLALKNVAVRINSIRCLSELGQSSKLANGSGSVLQDGSNRYDLAKEDNTELDGESRSVKREVNPGNCKAENTITHHPLQQLTPDGKSVRPSVQRSNDDLEPVSSSVQMIDTALDQPAPFQQKSDDNLTPSTGQQRTSSMPPARPGVQQASSPSVPHPGGTLALTVSGLKILALSPDFKLQNNRVKCRSWLERLPLKFSSLHVVMANIPPMKTTNVTTTTA